MRRCEAQLWRFLHEIEASVFEIAKANRMTEYYLLLHSRCIKFRFFFLLSMSGQAVKSVKKT